MKVDTSANFLGLRLHSPIVVGSCSLTQKPELVRELSIAGAGAIVLPSLFEEQIVHQRVESAKPVEECEAKVEADCYREAEDAYNGGPDGYIDTIRRMKGVTAIPVIASLNGCTGGKWLEFSKDIEEAGVDAIEMILDSELVDTACTPDEVEQRLVNCVAQVCGFVKIPVSVKLTPYHTNLANLTRRLADTGAAGLVCFAHEPGWRIEPEQVTATLTWALTPASCTNSTIAGLMRVRSSEPEISLAATGGIAVPQDLIKTIVAGADVAMVTSEVYRAGPDAIAHLHDGLGSYILRHGYTSFEEFKASRPAPPKSIRRLQAESLTGDQEYYDPTPGVAPQAGDRWGHLL